MPATRPPPVRDGRTIVHLVDGHSAAARVSGYAQAIDAETTNGPSPASKRFPGASLGPA